MKPYFVSLTHYQEIVNNDIRIRPETPSDVEDIRDVTRRAFAGRPYSGGNEQDIVDALRIQNALAISLVAEQAGRIVGHVAFSPASAEDASPGWYTLGPVSVDPDVQRRGIGQALVIAGIGKLRQLDASGCILIGDTNYYSRFGFVKAPQIAPVGEPKEHFMVLGLRASTPDCVVNFHAVFHQEG